MDGEILKQYLEDGLSLIQIGELENRDPSTVGYWVKKHGLTPNGHARHSARGALTRDELEPLVESGATLQEIAIALDRSVSTVRHWLSKHALKTKNRRGPRPSYDRPDVEALVAAGKRSAVARCHVHGETEFGIVGSSRRRLYCKRCRADAVVRRRHAVKRILVDEAGGACKLCGYDRCVAALHFHHLDPGTKSFGLSANGVTRGIDALRVEARKCVLLCSNCHSEVEAGVAVL